MKILGLTIMTNRAYARTMKTSVAGGVALGRVAGKYNLDTPADEDIAARLAEVGEVYELGIAHGRSLAEQETGKRREYLRFVAADRSRERRQGGHLHLVQAAEDGIA